MGRRVPSDRKTQFAGLRSLARRLYHAGYPVAVRLWCWGHWLRDRLTCGRADGPAGPAPPPLLRFKVGGTPSRRDFLSVGQGCSEHLQTILRAAGTPLEAGHDRRVLDFGCGCGRTLIWLAKQFPRQHYYGCDSDGEAIDWCRRRLAFGRFAVSRRRPPLPFRRTRFDLIYAISVFSHLDARDLHLWLRELAAHLTPSGGLLLTVHGRRVWSHFSDDQQARIRERGHLTLASRKLKGIFPDWYQTTLHTEPFVRDACSHYFGQVDYFAEGMGYQDAVLCRRPVVDGAGSDSQGGARPAGGATRGQSR